MRQPWKSFPAQRIPGITRLLPISRPIEQVVSEFYLMRKCNALGNKSHVKGMNGEGVCVSNKENSSRIVQVDGNSTHTWRTIASNSIYKYLQR